MASRSPKSEPAMTPADARRAWYAERAAHNGLEAAMYAQLAASSDDGFLLCAEVARDRAREAAHFGRLALWQDEGLIEVRPGLWTVPASTSVFAGADNRLAKVEREVRRRARQADAASRATKPIDDVYFIGAKETLESLADWIAERRKG